MAGFPQLADDQLGTSLFGGSNSQPNPLFDYLTGFVPRKLKDLFRWTEYLAYNSTHIYAAMYKIADYSITDINYKSDNAKEKERHKKLLEQTLRVKSILKACSRDRMIYGNSFISLYLPFMRNLVCPHCKMARNIQTINYKFRWKDTSFRWSCDGCKSSVSAGVKDIQDVKLPNPAGINIIRWDPKLMDIDYNPMTGQSVYYYTIPKEVKEKVRAGNKHVLNSMPIGFLEAIKEDRIFKFDHNQLYHMKIEAPAGVDAQWGFPPLTSTVKGFLYCAVLRKANESIALDFIVPMRVLHPAQQSSVGDPVASLNMNNWVSQTRESIRKWRRDPLHIQFSPVPLGYTQLGGNGRMLLTSQEIKDMEDNILSAIGVPREFIYGGLSVTGSAVTLRMLENQLTTQTKDLEELMNWIDGRCANFLDWEPMELELQPFKLVDDVQQKTIVAQLNQNGDILSKTTMAELFGYDLAKERKLREQEAIDEARLQASIQKKVNELQNTLTNQVRAQAGTGSSYNPQLIMQQADQLVQSLSQMDHGQRKSELDKLKSEDFVMYSVASKRLEDYNQSMTAQAKAQAQGQSQGSPQQ